MLEAMQSVTNTGPFDAASARMSSGSDAEYWRALAASAILILGSPRSGATWLAKIFDSHPDILYRHEPDELSPARKSMPPAEQITELISQRGLRSAGKRPFFREAFRPVPLEVVREGLALVLAGAQRLSMTASTASRIGLPGLLVGQRRVTMRAVLKLVHWDGSMAAASAKMPCVLHPAASLRPGRIRYGGFGWGPVSAAGAWLRRNC